MTAEYQTVQLAMVLKAIQRGETALKTLNILLQFDLGPPMKGVG